MAGTVICTDHLSFPKHQNPFALAASNGASATDQCRVRIFYAAPPAPAADTAAANGQKEIGSDTTPPGFDLVHSI